MRAAWSWPSDTALAQSARCTVTPRPRVMKPMISSPGTGVQQRDRRTITSSRPSTCTPTRRAAPALAAGLRDGDGELLLLLAAAERPGDALRHRPARHVVLADGRRTGRRGRRSFSVGGLLGQQRRTPSIFCTGRPSRRSSRDQLLPARLERVLAALAGEPLADLVAGPRATTIFSQSRLTARRRSTFEVKISHVSPDCSAVVERHEATVDPGADAGVADLGVHGVGEVDRRGPDRAA